MAAAGIGGRGVAGGASGRRAASMTALALALAAALAAPSWAEAQARPQTPSAAAPAAQAAPPRVWPDARGPRPDPRPPLPPPAPAYAILDVESGRVLAARRADAPRPPASLTKLMTAYMALEAVRAGALKLSDPVAVSARAAGMRGSAMRLRAGERPPLEALLFGLMVNSGNDAAVAIAERLAGSERAFARRMTRTAAELGLETARFRNASGWPDARHRVSARDLARLAGAIWRRHPGAGRYFAPRAYDWPAEARAAEPAPWRARNRNPLIARRVSGGAGEGRWRADGMKTGYTKAAGYGLAASGVDAGGRRVVAVLMGLKSEAARARAAERALDWGMRAAAALRGGR